jgi:hypothetical protein
MQAAEVACWDIASKHLGFEKLNEKPVKLRVFSYRSTCYFYTVTSDLATNWMMCTLA